MTKFKQFSRRHAVQAAMLGSSGAWFPTVSAAGNSASLADSAPIRGVWVAGPKHNRFWQSAASMREHMAAFEKAGRNVVYLACLNHGRTHWPSHVMRDVLGDGENGLIAPEFRRRDPLEEAIDAGKAHNIRVVAWLEFGFSSHHTQSPYARNLLVAQPGWAAKGRDGKLVVKNQFHWMNAFDPAVQGLLTSLCLELARKYADLSGVQGDDRMPALPSEGGYHDDVLAAFTKSPLGETASKSSELPNTKNRAWLQWRADRLTEWLAELRLALKAVRPAFVLSLSPSIHPFALEEYLQDWPKWLRLGLCDELMPQLYRKDFPAYERIALATGKLMAANMTDMARNTKLASGLLWSLGQSQIASLELLRQCTLSHRAAGIPGDVLFHSFGVDTQPEAIAAALR